MHELRGTPVADFITEGLKIRIEKLKEKGVVPRLSVVRVGANEGDISYERSIIKKFKSQNAAVDVAELPVSITHRGVHKPLPDRDRRRDKFCGQ